MSKAIFLTVALVAAALTLPAGSVLADNTPESRIQLAASAPLKESTRETFRQSCITNARTHGSAAQPYCGCVTDLVAQSYSDSEYTTFEANLIQAMAVNDDGSTLQRFLGDEGIFRGIVVTCGKRFLS